MAYVDVFTPSCVAHHHYDLCFVFTHSCVAHHHYDLCCLFTPRCVAHHHYMTCVAYSSSVVIHTSIMTCVAAFAPSCVSHLYYGLCCRIHIQLCCTPPLWPVLPWSLPIVMRTSTYDGLLSVLYCGCWMLRKSQLLHCSLSSSSGYAHPRSLHSHSVPHALPGLARYNVTLCSAHCQVFLATQSLCAARTARSFSLQSHSVPRALPGLARYTVTLCRAHCQVLLATQSLCAARTARSCSLHSHSVPRALPGLDLYTVTLCRAHCQVLISTQSLCVACTSRSCCLRCYSVSLAQQDIFFRRAGKFLPGLILCCLLSGDAMTFSLSSPLSWCCGRYHAHCLYLLTNRRTYYEQRSMHNGP